MAELAELAFERHSHALIEAGTGTGKTLAYLIPALRSGRRVVISTATKSLQEQLFQKDIPFIRRHFAPDLKVALMKGRNNFLCRVRVSQMDNGQAGLKGIDEIDWFAQIKDWSKLTETGDRAELNFLPDDSGLWGQLDARREICTGPKCAEFSRCFLTTMHQRAAEADLIIVNHHLFFADLALKQDDFGSILPEYSAVVFDEAHEIEDVASEYFGRQISSYRFDELGRDAENILKVTQTSSTEIRKAIARMRERGHNFFERFPTREGKIPVRAGGARRVSRSAPGKLRRIGFGLEAPGSGDWRADRQAGRAAEYRAALRGTAAGAGFSAGERGTEFRLLVRAARQRRVRGRDAHRRQRHPSGKAFRAIRHRAADLRDAGGGRPL
jgi:ATP-dependent DNA helicase DinG